MMAMMTKSATIRSENRYNGGRRHQGGRIGETAGDCAAIVCCCPCATIHVLILALYRLPTGLCKTAWRMKRHGLLKKKVMISMEKKENQSKENYFGFYTDACYGDEESTYQSDTFGWDSEISDHFYGYGFWRSASQRIEQRVNGTLS